MDDQPQAEFRPETTTANDFPTPSKPKIEHIIINEMDYGYTVEVGCQKFVFETHDRLIEVITRYIRNPEIVRNNWMQNQTLP